MKILVILKKTPDTETKIKLTGDSKAIDFNGVKFIVNPYDEFAIEEALKIKEAQGGEVTIVSVGPADTKELIIKGLAMGAEKGALIDNAHLPSEDSLVVAKVLAAYVKRYEPDLILAGKQAIDDDNMHVPTMLAELLDWPHVNVVTSVQCDGTKVVCEREVEGGQVEVYEMQTPCVLGAHKSLNQPRYAPLPGIMKAKRKPFENLTIADLGVDEGELSSVASTTIDSFEYPPEKPPGKVLQGEDIAKMVDEVVQLLRSEAKVI